MRKVAEPNGYMTLKIELVNTKISRTVVVPEHMTLADLNDAIQSVMGWQDEHLWSFSDKRRDGALYELPRKDDGFPPFSRRLTLDVPDDCEDVGKAIDELRKEQSRFPRWHPQTRADLFDFEDFNSFANTAESDRIEELLKKICGTNGKYEPVEALFAIYCCGMNKDNNVK